MGKVGSKVEGRVGRVGDMKRGGGEYPVSLLRRDASHSLKPVLDGDATCFVGISARRSVLFETETGSEVLVTSGT
jgi:hypothetical protein